MRDAAYHALREALGASIVAALLDLAAHDRPRFLQLCDWHHDAIRAWRRGMEFSAAVLDHLPFENQPGAVDPARLSLAPASGRPRQTIAVLLHS